MPLPCIAAIDIGKTNARVVFMHRDSGDVCSTVACGVAALEMPIGRQLDVAGMERWLIEVMAGTSHARQLSAIVPITHGASAVMLDASGNVLAAPDYEDPRFDLIGDAHELVTDPFAETLSPSLPLGLNLARQLHYFESQEPDTFSRVAHVLTYPQYWAWRLSGVMASEVSSLGCHTQLWLPRLGTFSKLAVDRGWSKLFPPMRFAGDALGPILPSMARETGIAPHCAVHCGLHDSNASYLQHFSALAPGRGLAVVSSGTWTVVMASGVPLDRLSAARDMLANVDVFGRPVGTARFMGGREFEVIAGVAAGDGVTLAEVQRVIELGIMALPGFAAEGGPFRHHAGKIAGTVALTGGERRALATLYVALMTDLLLDELGVRGDIVIDGPLAKSDAFLKVLASLRPLDAICAAASTGTAAALYLVTGRQPDDRQRRAIAPTDVLGLPAYRGKWRAALP